MGEPLLDRHELSRVLRVGLRDGRRICRRMWRSRAVTVLLLLVLLGGVRALSIRQRIETRRWGAVRTVVVAKFAFSEGHRIVAHDLAERALPLAAIPAQAIATLELAKGRRLRTPVTAGQVLTDVVIGAPKARALLSSIGQDRVAIAIATSGPRPPIQLGDRVDVHSITSAADQPLGAIATRTPVEPDQPNQPDQPGALNQPDVSNQLKEPEDLVVVAVTDQAISVATPTAEVQRLVALLRSGPVLIALRGR
jgi:SAF domain